MRIGLVLIFLFAIHTCSSHFVVPQSSDLLGRWKVDIIFKDQSQRSLRFDAEEFGKGSFLMEEPKSNWSEPSKSTRAKWMVEADKRVTFSGPVSFPIGNVGREAGTLVFKGIFEREDLISGEVAFFYPDQDPTDLASPNKSGKFKATRVRSD
jgi:hypothetical protein